MSKSVIERAADNIRILSVAMVEKAKSGHPGGAMGGADFVNILFSEFLRFDPDDMAWPHRDRFFLDPGHMSPMLYSILALTGNFTIDELKNFRQWGSPTHGHPELNVLRGIENTSGPLGIGHALSLGSAIAERFFVERFTEIFTHKTYAFISDGGIQEEISQGVGRLAGHLGISNLIMFYDSNDIQLSHETSSTSSEDITKKYEAWGWRVETIDGQNADEIRSSLKRANEETDKPTLIIGKTTMGKGALTDDGGSFERQLSTHGQPISAAGASVDKTIENLGGDPANPFVIFDDVAENFKAILDKKREEAAVRKNDISQWKKANSDLAAKFDSYLNGDIPDIDFENIEHSASIATRAASGDVLKILAQQVGNMVVSSADLSNSDQTGKFLGETTEFAKGDFSGAFLQAGVAELTMAAIMNGMALHGGIIPACATFFVFSDYMKPAIRMAALMELPVKFIWTHDAFRVGEDGPTHQPIEQEAQIRLLEKMKNLSGKRSMLVLRPADSAETTVSWKMALENKTTPSALILTRQNVPDIEPVDETSSRYQEALKAEKGAYIVKKASKDLDLVLVGNGSEVGLLIDVAKSLEADGLGVQVVSAISEGLFKEQSEDYRESVIPSFTVPVFGLTAGLPAALCEIVGPLGKVIGLERFGASAPFKVLEEKFGYTVDAVKPKVLDYIKEYKESVKKLTR